MWARPASNAIPRDSLPGCQQPAQAVTAIPSSTQVCLAWIVPDAIRRIIGLQDITARTRELQMKVEEGLIMAVARAAIVTHRPCIPPRAPRVMIVTIPAMRVEETELS